MQIKKFLAAGAASILAAALLVTPVSAHHGQSRGHHGQNQNQDTTVPSTSTTCGVCHWEGCTSTGRHTHNGTTYCSFNHDSGLCDGTCVALCTVEGCTLAGHHTHNDTTYCGYHHENGFCDGTCVALCTVEGCTDTEPHQQNQSTY